MDVDVCRIIADIKLTAEEIKPLKRALRQRWDRPMADTQRALARLARRATELCVLRAHLRGRVHLRHRPASWCGDWEPARAAERIAGRVALVYARPSSEETA